MSQTASTAAPSAAVVGGGGFTHRQILTVISA